MIRSDRFSLSGASEGNLQSVSLSLPFSRLTVIHGPSGAGKSSLLMDTIAAECRRRTEHLLAAAKGRMGETPSPRLDSARGLLPAVLFTPLAPLPHRSLASLLAVTPLLRTLIEELGEERCGRCGGAILQLEREEIVTRISTCYPGELIAITGRLTAYSEKALEAARRYGYSRAVAHGKEVHLDEENEALPLGVEPLDLIVDRLRPESSKRLVEALEAASIIGERGIGIYRYPIDAAAPPLLLSEQGGCVECGAPRVELGGEELEEALDAGTSLSEEAGRRLVGGEEVNALLERPLQGLYDFFHSVERVASDPEGALLLFTLDHALRLDLGHLSLKRLSSTLSRGELHRTALSRFVSRSRSSFFSIVDEPTRLLHPSDAARVGELLRTVVQAGGTVIAADHDPDLILSADHLVSLGPGSGPKGGKVLFSGPPPERVTARPLPPVAGREPGPFLTISGETRLGARLELSLARGGITCITGRSGSGKTLLLRDVVVPALEELSRSGAPEVSRVTDTAACARGGSQGMLASYVNLFTPLRELFGRLPLAKIRGFDERSFLLSGKGSLKCSRCRGSGEGEAGSPCPSCDGSRYRPAALEVKFKGRSLAEFLLLPVREALDLLHAIPALGGPLRRLESAGVGHLPLGSPLERLSSGERQRLAVLKALRGGKLGSPGDARSWLVLDRPTTGLDDDGIDSLVGLLREFIASGSSVVVLEVRARFLASVDFIVETVARTEGAHRSTAIGFIGTPYDSGHFSETATGSALKRHADRLGSGRD